MKRKLMMLLLICTMSSCALLIKESSSHDFTPSGTLNLFFFSMLEGDFETAADCISNETINRILDDYFDISELDGVNISVEEFNDMTDKQKITLILSLEADEIPDNYSIEVLSEEINGDEATVHFLSKENGDEYEDNIIMIREQGKWKITDND